MFFFLGLKCFRSYFESVNIHEHRIHKNGPTLVIDKQDLTGMSYLWQLVLESSHQDIAENAAIYLINVSFKWLTPKLKKVVWYIFTYISCYLFTQLMSHSCSFLIFSM